MVTKKKKTDETEAKKGRVKVGKLQLNKETVKDLATNEEKMVRGGAAPNDARLTGPKCSRDFC